LLEKMLVQIHEIIRRISAIYSERQISHYKKSKTKI